MSNNLKQDIRLVETLLTQRNVLSVDASAYELTALMREYRSQAFEPSPLGDRAVVGFYSDEEKEDFARFLRSKRIKFVEVGEGNQEV